MNILFIANSTMIAQRDLLTAKTLNKRYKISAIIRSNGGPKNYHLLSCDKITEVKSSNLIHFLFQIAILPTLRQADSILFSSIFLFPGLLFLKLIFGYKIIYNYAEYPISTISEILYKYLPFIPKKVFYTLFTSFENFLLSSANGILSIPLVPDQLSRIRKKCSNLAIINNYPPINTLSQNLNSNRKTLPDKYIVYTGTVASYTGLKQYLELILQLRMKDRFSDIKLVIAGKAGDEYGRSLENLIHDFQLENQVIYYGWLPYNEIISIIDNSLIALALFDPSHPKFKYLSSGSSRKIFTYMSRGVPILSNLPLGEPVLNHECGVLVTWDQKEIFNSVCILLDDQEYRSNCHNNGLQAVRDKCNWESQENIIGEIIENYRF